MTFLDLRGITRRYGAVAALDGVDLAVPVGSRTAILGPSGSGKSTLLRIIAGFEAPDAGRVTLDGALVADGPAATPAHLRGIGLVAQDGALFPHLSIADNIGFGLPRRAPHRADRIAELMAMVELDPAMLRRRPDQLSGGQQQRVALARALARSPRLMLLDEPFSALDTGLRASTRKAVTALLEAAGITTILVTHDQAEALSFADQVAVMRSGRLLQAGTPRELYLRPRDSMIAEFLGDAIILPAQLAEGWADCALGRIAVDDRRHGPAQIMLRPEQLALADARDGAPGTRGEVAEIDFAGSVCTVTVRLPDGPAGAQRLLLRRPGLGLPAVGARVRITVQGEAHVFAGDP
ncbi:iron(III) transport system ATP-binding protein [Inquilinus ginsengisoli]|uniref:Iron(III) transport system ATP-binding protein n=1 Tax=Inquilinus ginsengisoli TaxID=363840 RepID=A0ABU1JYQ1_9PROT|nr:ABC transporter ATP-binding protein [Inquilinus ginsengisoli]MDR6293743.1 iron(III) transport system ATP-binding protein [Inquilinus ginsengisoli]